MSQRTKVEAQDYLANFAEIKRLRPDYSAFETLVAACQAELFKTPADPVAAPTHRSQRPLYFDAPELRKVDQMLDVGGGPGFVASLLKEEIPHIKVTVFDLPGVCEHALDIFRESGQEQDLGAHPGDFFIDPFPSGFRTIQLSHILELFPPNVVLRLLQKSFDALPRGGRLMIYGLAHEQHPGVPGITIAPELHSVGQYLQWVRTAGFCRATYRRDNQNRMFMCAVK